MTSEDAIGQLTAHALVDRMRAESDLIASGTAFTEALIGALRDAEPERRWRAAYVLGDTQASQAVPMLLQLLDDQVWDVRAAATYALGEIADVTTFDTCARVAFAETPDEQTPYIAALGLRRMDPERAQVVLADTAANGGDERRRRIAASALATARWA